MPDDTSASQVDSSPNLPRGGGGFDKSTIRMAGANEQFDGRLQAINPETGQYQDLYLDESNLSPDPTDAYTFNNTGVLIRQGGQQGSNSFSRFMDKAIPAASFMAAGQMAAPAFGAVAGEGAGAAMAGGGEVGSGYAAAAPGYAGYNAFGGASMPAAIPQTAASLGAEGLVEVAPGVWHQGAGGSPSSAPSSGTPIDSTSGQDVPPPGDEPLPYMSSAPETATPPAGTDSPFPPSEMSQTPSAGTPTATALPVGTEAGPSSELITEPPGSPPSTNAPPKPTLSDRALSAITNNPLMTGALGLNLAGQVQASQAQKKREAEARRNVEPASNASRQLIEQGMAGQVPPAIMAQFDRSLNDRVLEIKQRYANMGRDAKTDSAAQEEIRRATAAKDAQVAKYAQDLITTGLQAAGVSAGPSQAAIQAGAAQDKALQNAMGGTLNSMAMLEALKNRQTPAPTA